MVIMVDRPRRGLQVLNEVKVIYTIYSVRHGVTPHVLILQNVQTRIKLSAVS